MHHVNARLEMLVRGDILVVGRGGDVVGEADAVVAGAEVHVEQALVGAVEGLASVGHGAQAVVLGEVGRQDHDARVEDVGPPDVRGGGEGGVDVKELVGGAVGDDIGVDVDDL